MQELSLSILDIAQNSIKACATKICISLDWNYQFNKVQFLITDNGNGIPFSDKNDAWDPFFTSRTSRMVGLGLSLLKMDTKLSNGVSRLFSNKEYGTSVYAEFQMNHVNRPALGDLASTLCFLVQGNPLIDFYFYLKQGESVFECSTRTLCSVLAKTPIESPLAINILYSFIANNIYFIKDMGCYLNNG